MADRRRSAGRKVMPKFVDMFYIFIVFFKYIYYIYIYITSIDLYIHIYVYIYIYITAMILYDICLFGNMYYMILSLSFRLYLQRLLGSWSIYLYVYKIE